MKKILIDIFLIITLVSVLTFLWFSNGLLFAGGEEGIPFYDLNKTVDYVSYSWQDISGGFPIQILLNRIPYFNFLKYLYSTGFSSVLVQAIHFFIIMSFGTLSFYFLLYKTIGEELKMKKSVFQIVPLAGAIFYLLNPFSMAQIWGRGLYMQFFPFAFFPFFLLMFILGLKFRNFIFGILGLLASVVFAGSFGNPTYIFSFWAINLIYFVCFVIKNPKRNEVLFALFYFLFLAIGWFVINLWWLYPLFQTQSNQFSMALENTEAKANLGNLKELSKEYQLPSLLRLIHEGFYYRGQTYGTIYLSPLFIFLSWIAPIVAFFSYFTFRKLKFYLFFGTFFLFSLFMNLGSNLPSGPLFVWIFQTFPSFQAFRNPFEKSGLILIMAYSPFFAVGSVVVSLWLSKFLKNLSPRFFVAVTLILVCGFFLWPMWTGHFAGGFKLNPWIKVPDYYKSLNDWLSKQADDGRMIHFPINGGDGLRYSGWEHPYTGIEPGEYIFSKSSIGKNGQASKLFYNVLLQRFNKFLPKAYGPDPDITTSEFRSENLYKELAKLNVRYIILHKDIDPYFGLIGPYDEVGRYLETQQNIKKINTFGKLDVYKVEIPDNIHLIYSPDVNVSYFKINPTHYSAHVDNADKEFDLYFLENFNPDWEADVDGKKIEGHTRVFSYGNRWKIKKTGSFTFIVKYKPQDFVDEGMKITKNAVLVLTAIYLFYLTLKIWKKVKI